MVIFENLGNYARIYSKVSFRILFLWEVLWGFSTMCNVTNMFHQALVYFTFLLFYKDVYVK